MLLSTVYDLNSSLWQHNLPICLMFEGHFPLINHGIKPYFIHTLYHVYHVIKYAKVTTHTWTELGMLVSASVSTSCNTLTTSHSLTLLSRPPVVKNLSSSKLNQGLWHLMHNCTVHLSTKLGLPNLISNLQLKIIYSHENSLQKVIKGSL